MRKTFQVLQRTEAFLLPQALTQIKPKFGGLIGWQEAPS
jgi:hypothetical protein